MNASASLISSAWEVLLLFLIPIGGGIPGGVLLAKSRGLRWPVMAILYLISDVILACIFEPLMRLVILASKRSPFLARVSEAMRKSVKKSTSGYGTTLGPLALVMISFGIDPMTGRAATVAKGHGFVAGWTLAIAGDMLFFLLLMVSTLWLSNILGDGTAASIIIMVLMIFAPGLVRRIWRSFKPAPSS